jgi:hypothetical protein
MCSAPEPSNAIDAGASHSVPEAMFSSTNGQQPLAHG